MISIYKKTNKNIVTPQGVVLSNQTQDRPVFNYNTYLMLTPVFKALIISSLSNSGDYHLIIRDLKMGFYFNYSELNLSIKVPLSAIFNTNNKLEGILGIKWASAIECPSRRRGMCQLDDPNDCYAYSGERQGSKKSYNYLMGMGSYYNSLLSIYYFNLFNKNAQTRTTFKRYCKYYGVTTLRFNLSGDFKNIADIKNLEYLAKMGLDLTGYTARDDLRAEIMNVLNKHDNIIINGSNMMYTNVFNAVESIETYFKAQYQCLGGCMVNGCLNCYKYHNIVITVLLHGARAGLKLNTPNNRAFIVKILNKHNIPIGDADLKKYADLYRGINSYFKTNNLMNQVPSAFKKVNDKGAEVFNGHSGFIQYLRVLFNKYAGEL